MAEGDAEVRLTGDMEEKLPIPCRRQDHSRSRRPRSWESGC